MPFLVHDQAHAHDDHDDADGDVNDPPYGWSCQNVGELGGAETDGRKPQSAGAQYAAGKDPAAVGAVLVRHATEHDDGVNVSAWIEPGKREGGESDLKPGFGNSGLEARARTRDRGYLSSRFGAVDELVGRRDGHVFLDSNGAGVPLEAVSEAGIAEPPEVGNACPFEDLEEYGCAFDDDADAGGAAKDEGDVRQGADYYNEANVFPLNSLLDDEGVLWANRHDQRDADEETRYQNAHEPNCPTLSI